MRPTSLALSAVLLARAAGDAVAPSPVRYELVVDLEPASGRLDVVGTLALGEPEADGEVVFLLHEGLSAVSRSAGVEVVSLPETTNLAALDLAGAGFAPPEEPRLRAWRVRSSGTLQSFAFAYEGRIHHPPRPEGEAYARSFGETPGTIGEEGAYLAGSSFWYPWIGDALVTFSMTARTPPGWEAVSEGRRDDRVAAREGTQVTWVSTDPTEEIHLVAAPLAIYEDRAGDVATYAYLRTPDEALARRYLDASARYLAMYGALLGPYPYAKFALVENFWETGYGMPSFTLLGPAVIRLPFILHSSYPHEILHNWWGNGVFVDRESGNWCEGLTAYLADHLIREQAGEGAAYRRDLLQKYADYVREGRDFPLREFRERHSAATEAVGYGKAAMLFHMLRRRLGDEAFVRALRAFYAEHRFRRASFDDLRRSFEAASGRDLRAFVDAWVGRPGVPTLRVAGARAHPATREEIARAGAAGGDPGGFEDPHLLEVDLEVAPAERPFPLDVPLALSLEGRAEALVVRVPASEAVAADGSGGARDPATALGAIREHVPRRPLRVQVDPDFDVFRRLDPEEVPPSLGGVFGAPRLVILLPGAAPAALRDAYRALAEAWSVGRAAEVGVVADADLDDLPPGAAAWILGWDNRFRDVVAAALGRYDARLTGEALEVPGETARRAERSVVVAVRRPDDPALAVAFLGADDPAAVPGLARKLPHYGKYGYLAFAGEEPANVLKGQWPVAGSPLEVAVETPPPAGAAARGVTGGAARDGASEPARVGPAASSRSASPVASAFEAPAARRPAERPLATLPPAFSERAMREDAAFLASDDLQGRGCGSEGLARAAAYVEDRFREAGLLPGADDGSYRQAWTAPCGEGGAPAEMVNLVGVVPGRRAGWERRSLIVVAHYDHLGLGWPDARAGERGLVHNGADDNASGVAVMLELARALAGSIAPERSVVFLATCGEESGLRGARHYVESATRRPAREAIAALNLDTVGRLEGRSVLVLGSGSAAEWVHIVRGSSHVSGTPAEPVMDDLGASDQTAFLEAGVPAVQLFTGPHLDYHRPTDDVERLDTAGMVKVAALAKEFIEYLAAREEPLRTNLPAAAAATATGGDRPAEPAPAAPPESPAGRRVSLGTVPDFAYEGPGYRLGGVVPGSPAEAAGLREGDVIVRLGDRPIEGLRDLSAALGAIEPGSRVRVAYRRDGVEREVDAVVDAR